MAVTTSSACMWRAPRALNRFVLLACCWAASLRLPDLDDVRRCVRSDHLTPIKVTSFTKLVGVATVVVRKVAFG